MNTFLTVYFWVATLLSVIMYLTALFMPVKPAELWKHKGSEDFYKALGQVFLLGTISVLTAAPLVYLQWRGLEHLGLASWWAVTVMVLNTVAVLVRVPQIKKAGSAPIPLPLFALLLAWYGLQVLTA